MLQESLVTDTDLIELIQINQRKTIQIEHGMAFFAEIQIIRIIEMQFRRKNLCAKSRFINTLRAHQQW